MRKLRFTLATAQTVHDPKKRATMLAAAALEDVESILLLGRALHEAEQAALLIEDPEERQQMLESVHRVMERAGYDSKHKAFLLKRAALAASNALVSVD